MCDNNIPLKYYEHSEAYSETFENEEQGDDGKKGGQSNISHVQPSEQHSMHVEKRLEVKS